MCMSLKLVRDLCRPVLTYGEKCGFRNLLQSQSDVCMERKWFFFCFII